MKKFEKKSAGPLERLRLRSGIYASAVTVLVVVLAVLLNLIVRAVPTKYTEFDLSEAGLYTLSDSSKDIAHALTQDVTIYYLAETGSEDAIITKLLDRYASESSHIKWETKDPAIYPTFAAQYGVQSAENGSLILVSGEKSAVLAASDLYDYDYSDYYTTGNYSVTFGGENKLTAAIYRITSGEELHAYYTTNHGEQRLTDTLTDALEGQNLSVSPLDLLTDTIPDDCDLLIINDPQQDVAPAGGLVDEMSALRAYLKNGGHLMLTTDSYYSTPNLDALMAEFGLTRTPGLVVEGDSGHYLNGYPYYLLPDYATDTESGTLDGIDTSRRVLLQMAQGITITETEGITSEALRSAYKAVEQESARLMASLQPEALRSETEGFLTGRVLNDAERKILKAADRLSALIKCLEECQSGNREFEAAREQQLAALHGMDCPEAEYFITHMLPCYTQNLDELTRGRF